MSSSKLRVSCNACHVTKVKCVKTDQACVRCKSIGQQCQFSPALPRIYNKKRPKTSTKSPRTPLANGPATLRLLAAENQLFDPLSSETLEYCPSPTIAGPQANTYDIEASWPLWSPGDDIGGADSVSTSLFGACKAGADLPLSEQLSVTPALIEGDPTSSYSPSDAQLSQLSNSPRLHRGQHFDSWMKSMDDKDQQYSSKCEQIREGECTCLSLLLLAMQSVCENLKAQSPALDVVLQVNRSAVEHCQSTLHCPCTGPNISLKAIACGLLDLVLTSYQSALQRFSSDLDEEPDLTDSGAHGLKLTLGGFSIEKRDQMFCVKEIVTREIRKVENLLLGASKPVLDGEVQELAVGLTNHLSQRCTIIRNHIQCS